MRVRGDVNGQAKKNKKTARREKNRIERMLAGCDDVDVAITHSEGSARGVLQKWMQQQIDLAILSGGDGIVEHHMTVWFREQFRKYGRGMNIDEFAHNMNAMALDKKSGVQIPNIYIRPKGTVCYYPDALGMTGNLENLGKKIELAERSGAGVLGFKRVYVPVFMVYSTDNPHDLGYVYIGTTYADGFLSNVFHEYYKPKEKGKSPSIATALKLIGRAGSSSVLDKLLPRDGPGGQLYEERYLDDILKPVKGSVTINNRREIIGSDEERDALALGTMGINLYGLKPFYRAPASPEKFVMYNEGEEPQIEDLDINDHMFHVLAGRVDPAQLISQLPNVYMGKETRIKGLTDCLASRVDLVGDTDSEFIVDGEEKSNGPRTTIRMAYLQPFLLPDYETFGDNTNSYLQRLFYRGMETAQDKIDEMLKSDKE